MNIALTLVLLAVTSQGAWTDLVDLAVQVLTPILLVLGGWLALKLSRKFGLESKAAAGKLGRQAVFAGIGYAERWAKKYAAEHDAKATGPQKLARAIEHIANMEGRMNIGQEMADAISRRIHSELGKDDLIGITAIGTGPTTPDE